MKPLVAALLLAAAVPSFAQTETNVDTLMGISLPKAPASPPARAVPGPKPPSKEERWPQTLPAEKDSVKLYRHRFESLELGAALYADAENEKDAKRWDVVFDVAFAKIRASPVLHGDGGASVFVTKPKQQIFGDGSAYPAFPGLSKISGLAGVDTTSDDTLKHYYLQLMQGSGADKGVFAYVRKHRMLLKDPTKACAGPVVWWGLDHDQALAACKKGSL